MAEMAETGLPPHIDRTVRAIAALHQEHRQRETPVQRVVRRSVAFIGRPRFVGLLTILIAAWIAANLTLGLHHRAFDPPPYPWLFDLGEALALYITVLILITQRRDDQLADLREQLSLELAILGEQKNAKIIHLLEELRRDLPMVPDRVDREAALLSVPADPQTVLDAIMDAQQERFDFEEPPA
jgi:uncharacterized membrane protein